MRTVAKNENIGEGRIDIRIEERKVIISDSGIGMTEDVLRNNFWRAGATGKNTELARKSGVVGTFGIGAMANFGVCSKLTVQTRAIDTNTTLVASAERSRLAVAQECITLQQDNHNARRDAGTTIIADLDDQNSITPAAARAYLDNYVCMLPVPVFLNGELMSQKTYFAVKRIQPDSFKPISERTMRQGRFEAKIEVLLDANGRAVAILREIRVEDQEVSGEVFLLQNGGQLMALRSSFGLAPVPIGGYYQTGGFANLSILHPTAGREALSQKASGISASLVSLAEHEISEAISKSESADRNSAFLAHIAATERTDLAGKVRIHTLPEEEDVPLERVVECGKGKPLFYYSGRDQAMLKTFSGEGTVLLHVSQTQPRGRVQQRYLAQIAKVSEVPDSPQITRIYKNQDLSIEEAAVLVRVRSTLDDDYLMPEIDVAFADITHGVTVLVKKSDDQLRLYLARRSAIVVPLTECWRTAIEVFPGFVKDFVRVHVFPRVADYVPSSARHGAETLRKLLQRNRELYRYEESETGKLESILE